MNSKIKNKFICIVIIGVMVLFSFVSEKLVLETYNVNSKSILNEDNIYLLGGDSVGIKILASGVLVIKSERVDNDIKIGDVILKVNDKEISTSKELEEIVKNNNEKSIKLNIIRDKIEKNIIINPIKDDMTGEYKLNLWVKDSSAGVGTVTFYEKNSSKFACLGHGITETEENYIVPIETGAITFTDIYTIKRGMANEPGEVKGSVTHDIIGSIIKNTDKGIYGKIEKEDYLENKEEIEIGSSGNIKEGDAYICTDINYGQKRYYKIKIEKVFLNSKGNKNMIIKIVDEELLKLTGGIIQGMSGSPIIQDGKLIGAVTHVLVNDPSKGYGVFIENMVEDIENI